MQTKIIIPELIASKKSVDTGKDYVSIKGQDGLWYQVWKENLFPAFTEGKPVKVKIQEIGKFRNIIEIDEAIKPSELKKTLKENASIAEEARAGAERGVCFNNACELVGVMYEKGEITKSDIVPEVKKMFNELLKIIKKEK